MASPPGTRVLARDQLTAFKDACRAFGTAVKDRLSEPSQIRFALTAHNLLGHRVVDQYTVPLRTLRPTRKGAA